MDMNYSLYFNEDHDSIREVARSFAEKTLAPIAAEIDATEKFPMDVVAAMAEMGLFGIKIPEEYGGIGMDTRSYVCVMEELARKSAAATIWVSSTNTLGSAPLLLFGKKEQKQNILPGIASGEIIIAFGLTEPNAGSDAASVSTKAVKDGDHYILNGRKCFITLAPLCHYCIIFAKTSPDKGAKGITAFLLDMSLPGVSCGRAEKKMGQRGVPVSDVVLEDVRVPKSCILGEVDGGFAVAMKTLDVGRIGVSSMSLGLAAEALDLAVAHTSTRIQFGRALSKQPVLRFMMADMQTKLSASRLLVYDAAYRMDIREDATLAASMAKYYSTEAAKDIIDKSLQLHGGYGYSHEYAIERIYRDIRINTIYEGSSQVQQIVIAGTVLS